MASVVRSIKEARRSKSRLQRPVQPISTKLIPLRSAPQPSTSPKLTVISGSVASYPIPLQREPSASSSAVHQMPQAGGMPAGVRMLMRTHRASIILAFVLGVAALVVYGSTVYTQQLWSKEYRKLRTLQRSERELLAAGESLKGQIAQQAERPGSQLVPKTPGSMIFLKPEPPRTTPAIPPAVMGLLVPTANKLQPPAKKPLGY